MTVLQYMLPVRTYLLVAVSFSKTRASPDISFPAFIGLIFCFAVILMYLQPIPISPTNKEFLGK